VLYTPWRELGHGQLEVCRHAVGVHGREWHVCLVMLDYQYSVLKCTWVAMQNIDSTSHIEMPVLAANASHQAYQGDAQYT